MKSGYVWALSILLFVFSCGSEKPKNESPKDMIRSKEESLTKYFSRPISGHTADRNADMNYGQVMQIPGTDYILVPVMTEITYPEATWVYTNLVIIQQSTGVSRTIPRGLNGYIRNFFIFQPVPDLPPHPDSTAEREDEQARNYWDDLNKERQHLGDMVDLNSHVNTSSHQHIARTLSPPRETCIFLWLTSRVPVTELSDVYREKRDSTKDSLLLMDRLVGFDYTTGAVFPITPVNAHIGDAQLNARENYLMLYVYSDSNQDQEINTKDRQDIYLIRLDNWKQPLKVTGDELYQDLKHQNDQIKSQFSD